MQILFIIYLSKSIDSIAYYDSKHLVQVTLSELLIVSLLQEKHLSGVGQKHFSHEK